MAMTIMPLLGRFHAFHLVKSGEMARKGLETLVWQFGK